MTTKDEAEALRLALEALERFGSDSYALEQKAVIACREALEQPAGETLSEDQSALVDKLKALLSGPANLTTQEAGAVLDAIRALLSSDAQPSEWVGLTEDEENALWASTVSDWELMKLTEKFLREKNAGKLFEDSLFFHEVKNSSNKLAPWLSAALEDPNSCSEFKAAIEWWFQSGITDIKHWPEAGKTVGINGLTHEEESATASVMGLVRKPAAEDKAGGDEPVASDPIYRLLASAWYYGNWKAETANEREMQAPMEKAGWWPITEEQLFSTSPQPQEKK